MQEGTHCSTSESQVASDYSKNDAPQGRMVPHVAIIRSERHGSRVSPNATPSPADICSKNDSLKRDKRHGAQPSSEGTSDLGFLLEQPKSSHENSKDNAFTKIATSRDAVIVHHDQNRGSIFTDCYIT
jgi:hypothetical protein